MKAGCDTQKNNYLLEILCIVYMFFSSLGPRVHVRYSRQFPTVIGKLATFQSLYHKTLD